MWKSLTLNEKLKVVLWTTRKVLNMNWLSGKKTYIVGVISILAAVAGAWDGAITWQQAAAAIAAAVGLMTVRSGVTTEVKKLE